MLQRLDKLISSQGYYSRSQAQKMIKDGLVRVNGVIVKDRGFKIDDDTSEDIVINGKPFVLQKYVYIMLNKPKGVVSASNDKNVTTVIDLVPEEIRGRNLFPAGRLDITTTGFVLITDDGDFAHRILSPKSHIEKTYIAKLAAPIGEDDLKKVADGITLGDGTQCMPAKLKVIESGENPVVEVKICEGKYHQIKRMFAAADNGVIELCRVKMGGVALDDSLSEGECRYMTHEEIIMLEKKEFFEL